MGYYEPQLIDGFAFDEVTSSLQKMIRRGKEYEACFWAYIIHQSRFGQYLWRRLSVICAEDIGNGEPLAPIVVSSLQQSWLLLNKNNKEPDLDQFLLVIQAILFLCRAKKTRENDSLSNLIEEDYKEGRRLEIDEISLDSHTDRGRKLYGQFGNMNDGKEKLRLDRWFEINSYISNKAYPDPWEEKIKEIWYGRIRNNKSKP